MSFPLIGYDKNLDILKISSCMYVPVVKLVQSYVMDWFIWTFIKLEPGSLV